MKPKQISRDEKAPGVRKELKRQATRKQRREGKKLKTSKRVYRGYSK